MSGIFLDLTTAAMRAHLSLRQFQRVIEEVPKLKLLKIGRKHFILTRDFDEWQERRKAIKR